MQYHDIASSVLLFTFPEKVYFSFSSLKLDRLKFKR